MIDIECIKPPIKQKYGIKDVSSNEMLWKLTEIGA